VQRNETKNEGKYEEDIVDPDCGGTLSDVCCFGDIEKYYRQTVNKISRS
jgi:hypothetical protein